MSVTVIVIIAIVAIVFLYIFTTQRKLVSLEEMTKNALGQISAQLQTRWDAVVSLVGMTKQYAGYEHDTLADVIAQRRGPVTSAADVNNQNSAIEQVLGKVVALSERYPELKASAVFLNTMDGIKGYEENVRLSRMTYNDAVTKINTLIRQWPSSFVASMLHFTQKEYVKEEQGKSGMPDVTAIFNSGK